MFHHAALAAAFVLCTIGPPQEMPAGTEAREPQTLACPPDQGLMPCPVDQTDLLKQGLTVDPRASQGARPLESEQVKPNLVDPGTVKLFPEEVPPKKKERED